jgi:hypothetical protein
VLLRFAPFRCSHRGPWKGPEVARRSWNVTDFVEMFRHWNAGRSQVQIYKALNIDRKTIRKYLAPALAEGLARSPDEPFDEEVFCCCMEPNDSYDRLIH